MTILKQVKHRAFRILCVSGMVCAIASMTFADATVPNVTGLPEASAVQAILDAGLTAGTLTRQYSSSLPDGQVIGQAPLAATLVADNTPVDLVTAMAPVLQINEPLNSVTANSYYHLTAYATPTESGIQHSEITSNRYENHTFSAIVEQDGSLSSEIPLESGENILTVSVTYPSGRIISQAMTVTYELSAIPDIKIISPEYGAQVSSDTVSLSGIVRSSLPADQIRLVFNDQIYFPSGENGNYTFEIPDVLLTEGINTLTLTIETPYGNSTAVSLVHYKTTDDEIIAAADPPRIEVFSPLPGSYVTSASIQVSGLVKGQSPIQSVWVNGQQATLVGSGMEISFDAVMICEGDTATPIQMTAEDLAGARGTVSYEVYYDTQNPVISVTSTELQTTQDVYTVKTSPFILSGTVTEKNLSELTLNGTGIGVVPMPEDTWGFQVPVSLIPNVENPVILEARDHAGHKTGRDMRLIFESRLDIEILSPANNSDIKVSSLDNGMDVLATIGGLTEPVNVYAVLDSNELVPLSQAGENLSGHLSLPIADDEHTLTLKITDSTSTLLEARNVSFKTINMDHIPLEVIRQKPENNSFGADTNEGIAFFFNKTIDPSLLSINVFETVHGKTYPTEKTGETMMTFSRVELVDVNKNNEPVPGGLSVFPENTMAAFYSEKEFSYGSTIHVTLAYDGEERYRSEFKVRPLPTLVEGFVLDQFMEPLEGIEVSLPELGRSTQTDIEGHYSFGFGEDASHQIKGGRYKILVNQAFKQSAYGTLDDMLIVDEGRLNRIKVLKLPALNKKEPFRQIGSGMNQVILSNGDLVLNLSQAQLLFPDGRTQGPVHTQFMKLDMLNHRARPVSIPHWVNAVQPMGITISGTVGIEMSIPMLNGSYDYLEGQTFVLLVGLDPLTYQISPVGMGRVNHDEHKVTSQGPVNLKRLDYIGYVMYPEEIRKEIQRVVDGEITLLQLLNDMESKE